MVYKVVQKNSTMFSVPADGESSNISEIEKKLQKSAIKRENLRVYIEKSEAVKKILGIRQKGVEAQELNTDSKQQSEQSGENVGQAITTRDLSGSVGSNTLAKKTGTLVKFSPLTGSDTIMRNGVTQTISSRHCCITSMKEYEGKTLEELRWEYYTVACKEQFSGAQTNGLFGSPAQPLLFSGTSVTTNTANTDKIHTRPTVTNSCSKFFSAIPCSNGFEAAAIGCEAASQPAATSELFAKRGADPRVTATTSDYFWFLAAVMKCALMVGDIVLANLALNKAWKLDPNNSIIFARHQQLEHLEYFLMEAEVAYAKNDFHKVVNCMARCREVSTMCTAFKQWQAECLMLTGRYQEAQEIADGILHTERLNVDALYVRAMCLANQNNVDQAFADFEEVFRLSPNYGKALDIYKVYARVMEASLEVGDILEAKSTLNKVLAYNPNNSEIWALQKKLENLETFLIQAKTAFAKKNFSEVVECMDRCCKISRSCPAFKLQKAEGMTFLRQFREAQEIADDILLIDKLNVDAIYVRGRCLYHQDMLDQALADFEEVFRLAPHYSKSLDIYKVCTRIMKSFLILGDISKAKYVLNKVLVHSPDNSETQAVIKDLELLEEFLSKAKAARAKDEFGEVVECMDRCCKISPSCAAFKLQKAEGMTFLRQFREAQEIADGVLRMDKKNVDAIYVRGMCLYNQRNLEQAVADFKEVFRLAPDHTKVLDIYKRAKALKQKNDEGDAAFKERKYPAALSLYSEALTIDPLNDAMNAKLHYNRAKIYAKLLKFDKSLEECDQALQLDEEYLEALLQRGACLMHVEDFEGAVFDFEQAYKISNREDIKKLLEDAKFAMRKPRRKNYYKTLGIEKNASHTDIKNAYRKLALVHHPDKHSNASKSKMKAQERKFKEVLEAYRILSEPSYRKRYDNGFTCSGRS